MIQNIFHCTSIQSRLHLALDGGSFRNDGKADTRFQGEKNCSLCYEVMSVVKEYNLCHHFDNNHRDKWPLRATIMLMWPLVKMSLHLVI